MPKYRSNVSLKRKGVRHPAGTDFTDLSAAEIKELRSQKLIAFVPPEEPADDEGKDAGKAPQK